MTNDCKQTDILTTYQLRFVRLLANIVCSIDLLTHITVHAIADWPEVIVGEDETLVKVDWW